MLTKSEPMVETLHQLLIGMELGREQEGRRRGRGRRIEGRRREGEGSVVKRGKRTRSW